MTFSFDVFTNIDTKTLHLIIFLCIMYLRKMSLTFQQNPKSEGTHSFMFNACHSNLPEN